MRARPRFCMHYTCTGKQIVCTIHSRRTTKRKKSLQQQQHQQKQKQSQTIIINEAKLICLLRPRELRFLLPHAVWHTHQPVVIHYISYIYMRAWALATFSLYAIPHFLNEVGKKRKTDLSLWTKHTRTHSHNILKNVCTLRRPDLYSAAHKHSQHKILWKLIWKAALIKVRLTNSLKVKKKTSVRFYRCILSRHRRKRNPP